MKYFDCRKGSRYCIYDVKFTSYCELIECSRPIRFFIVSLMYNTMYGFAFVCITFTSYLFLEFTMFFVMFEKM